MKRVKHFLILCYLKPKWFLGRLWRMTKYWEPLKDILAMEKEVLETELKAKREQDTKEILRSEGRQEVVKWLHDLFE